MSQERLGVRTWTWFGGIGLLVLLSALAVAGGAMSHQANQGNVAETAWYADNSSPSSHDVTTSQATTGAENANPAVNYAKSMSKAFHSAAEKVLPAVVMISNSPAMSKRSSAHKPDADEGTEDMPFGFKGSPFGPMFKNPEFRQFFKEFPSMPNGPRHGLSGSGSGVIVDPSGVVLTNNHVVAGGGEVTVRLQDGREFMAIDIKTDPKTDLAVLRIQGAGTLPAARLADSSKVDIGDWVLALGQPFGLQGTVTAGIVSAKGRGLGITDREDFIQTDAAINPGNSGGPLVDLDGQVVGINTAISSSSGGYQGVGFAIPANLAKWVGGQLVTNGTVHRAYLGVMIQPVTHPLAEQFKVKAGHGVLVTEVQPDTPAAKAGLKTGDIILQFSGQKVSSPRELQNLVEKCKIGSTQSLTVLRDGKQVTLDTVCRELPANVQVARGGSQEPGNSESSHFEKLGVQVETITPQIAEQLGVKVDHGVAITDIRSGSPAQMAGLTTGMVITEANRLPIKTVDDLRKAMADRPLAKGVLLLVHSAEGSRFVVIRTAGE